MRPGVAGVAERGHLTHTQRKTGPSGRQSVRRSLRVVAAVSVVWPVLVALTAAPAHAQADTTPPTPPRRPERAYMDILKNVTRSG